VNQPGEGGACAPLDVEKLLGNAGVTDACVEERLHRPGCFAGFAVGYLEFVDLLGGPPTPGTLADIADDRGRSVVNLASFVAEASR
jgi:hypothetical protein